MALALHFAVYVYAYTVAPYMYVSWTQADAAGVKIYMLRTPYLHLAHVLLVNLRFV